MLFKYLAAGLGLAVTATTATAIPSELIDWSLDKRATVSPDNTCGSTSTGLYTCDAATNDGACCSQYGYCGTGDAYCGDGCQTGYGTCNTTTTTTPTTSDSICGAANGGLSCIAGLCCSVNGYCGNTTDYCDAGCQNAYSDSCSDDVSTNNLCGPANGGAVCGDNECCSISGYCGATEDYCADPGNCYLGYGRCDSDATPAGASTINDARPLNGPVTYTDDIYDCVQNNVVALTYDDGPYLYTEQLLDILDEFGFKATFFITGNNNGKGEIDITDPYPTLIKRMYDSGHQVASHTWSHYRLSNITSEQRIQQMVKNEMAIRNIIGAYPTYMRPPYSDCTEESGCWADLQSLGYHRVYFDLDTEDYLNPLPSQIQNSKDIVNAALNTAGVTDYLSIQHDIVQQSVTNLTSYYYQLIKDKGWTGVTVAQCLGDTDKANWYRNSTAASESNSTSSVVASSTQISSSTLLSTASTSSASSAINSVTSSVQQSTTSVKASSTLSTSSVKASSTLSTSSIKSSTTTVKTTTTVKSAGVPGTTTTKTSAAASTPTCLVQSGNWCGKINTITSKSTCSSAVTQCYSDSLTCEIQTGFNFAACTKFAGYCTDLMLYCVSCGNSCSNSGFNSKYVH